MADTHATPSEGQRRAPVYAPRTDIFETKDALVLELEMPGVDGDTVTVSVDKRVLTVTGSAVTSGPADFALAHAEFENGDYERAFTLAEEVDTDAIEATMKNGLLTLTLPKAKPAEARTIQVKVG